MSGQGYAFLILWVTPRGSACVSLLSFRTRMGCCSMSADKIQVCGEWKRLGGKLTGDITEVPASFFELNRYYRYNSSNLTF